MSDTNYVSWEGRIFETSDTVHGTGQTIKLRVVKNDLTASGAAITVARDLCQFSSADEGDFGRRIGYFGTACSAGVVSKPLDDAYVVGSEIPDNDLFYVVEEGWCDIRTESSTANLSAHDPIAADGDGRINGAAAAAGEAVIGFIDQATTEESTAVRCWVNGGLSGVPAAG